MGSPTFHIYDVYSDELEAIIKKKIEDEIYKCRDEVKLYELKEQRLGFVIKEENEQLKVRKTLLQ